MTTDILGFNRQTWLIISTLTLKSISHPPPTSTAPTWDSSGISERASLALLSMFNPSINLRGQTTGSPTVEATLEAAFPHVSAFPSPQFLGTLCFFSSTFQLPIPCGTGHSNWDLNPKLESCCSIWNVDKRFQGDFHECITCCVSVSLF